MKMAKQQGVMIAINPDAHAAAGLSDLFYGIGTARKGWQEKRRYTQYADSQGSGGDF